MRAVLFLFILIGGIARCTSNTIEPCSAVDPACNSLSAALLLFPTAVSITPGRNDFNGDGWPDLVITAQMRTVNSNASAGEAYILYGGSDIVTGNLITTQPRTTIQGIAASDQLGYCIAGGDLNGDGYDDLTLGAGFRNAGAGATEGEIFIFYGGPNGIPNLQASSADVRIPGGTAGEGLGIACLTDDFNADGIDDLAVGAPVHAGNFGRAFVFHGSTGGITATQVTGADTQLTAQAAGDQLGLDLASGDINGDGVADLVVGAPGRDEAYVLYGTVGGIASINTAAASTTMTGIVAGDNFGQGLAVVDVTRDGNLDLIVGANGHDGALGTNQGEAYVFHGTGSTLASAGAASANQILQPTAQSQFGFNLATGDLNGDSEPDLVVGAPGGIGYAYVYENTTSGFLTEQIVIGGDPAQGSTFGSFVTVRDFNADGFGDVGVGAPNWDDAEGSNQGLFTLFAGSESGVASVSVFDNVLGLRGETGGDTLGRLR